MDEDVSLPRATLAKMMKEHISPNLRVSGELIDVMIECCTEFVHMVYSQANEVSTNEKKNIINPDHIIEALKQLGLSAWLPEVQEAWDGHKATSHKGTQKADKAGGSSQPDLSEEELAALQQKMLAEARARSFMLPENVTAEDDSAAAGANQGGS